jgi:hypothetical protein
MQILGVAIGLCSFVLAGIVVLRGAANRSFVPFPLFYSYISYCVGSDLVLWAIYLWHPTLYAHAYWFNYLVNTLAEFAVLVEISDHVFRPFAVIRNLGRALTLLISVGVGILYIMPAAIWSTRRSLALLNIALRASVTKGIILLVLFYVAQHYGRRLGTNVGGLMLGFSIYVAINAAIMASAQTFGPALFGQAFAVMVPLAFMLCLLVWLVSLWDVVPIPGAGVNPGSPNGNSGAVALELNRFNNELSKLLHK